MSAHQPDTARPSMRRVGQLSVAALAAAVVAVALLATPFSGDESGKDVVSLQSGPAADQAQQPAPAQQPQAKQPQAQQPQDISAKAAAPRNPPTPGNFTGYGFDQCDAPSQAAMDRWLQHSPFLAVGIYISGNSRACRAQPNLTAGWVRRQLAGGWRLLPITLGPQSTCVGRFPRYGKNIDPTISNSSTNDYYAARVQGRDTAIEAVSRARDI